MNLYNELINNITCPKCLSCINNITLFCKSCNCIFISFDRYSEFGFYLYLKNSATLRLQYIGPTRYLSAPIYKIALIREESSIYFNPLIDIHKYPFEYSSEEEFVKNINEILKSISKIERNLFFV